MPTTFSAATCITSNPGPIMATGPFNIYLNSDYDSTPFSSATLNELTNCPFIILDVPNGTTSLGFKDIPTKLCFDINILPNDPCSFCDLGLSEYPSTSVAHITAGVLTGSCNITDYQINWYGPNDPSLFLWSSGSGIFGVDQISASTYNHPLTGLQSPLAIEGIYTPILENVIIDGVLYSNSGATNSIPADLNCLPTIEVLPLTCDVRTNYTDNYTAFTQYLALDIASTDINPTISTLRIPAGTQYLAWNFMAKQIPDRLTITLTGTSYPVPIGLEDWVAGSGISNNWAPHVYPKSMNTELFFNKITTLTGLTISNNDTIEIKITPSTTGTEWYFYLACLEYWNCDDDCLTTTYYPKIYGNTISNLINNCGNTIRFNIEACYENNDYSNSDLTTYSGNFGSGLFGAASFNKTFERPSLVCGTSTNCGNNNPTSVCTTDSESTSYGKTYLPDGRGVFGFTGSSNVISTYYSKWTQKVATCWTGTTPNTDLYYYRHLTITIPTDGAPINCAPNDQNTNPRYITLLFHPTSTISSGQTGSQYYMSITANTMTLGITNFPSCSQCYALNDLVFNVNATSTLDYYATNRTFSAPGVYYTNPVKFYQSYTGTTGTAISGSTSGSWQSSNYQYSTYPFSGQPSTIIPSLSGTVCDYNQSGGVAATYAGAIYYTHYKYKYDVVLTNPTLNSNDFEIWAHPIINGTFVGTRDLAYSDIGGIITSNPTYVIP